jgi:hypothetical protein
VPPNASENDQISPSIAVRTARGEGSRPRHPPVLPERQKSAKIHAGSGFIWRISSARKQHRTLSNLLEMLLEKAIESGGDDE